MAKTLHMFWSGFPVMPSLWLFCGDRHYRVLSGFLPANESLILPVLHLSWLGVRYRVLSGSLPANESLHDVTCTTLIMTRRALLCFIGLLTCQWKPDVSLTTLIMTGRASLKANVLPALGPGCFRGASSVWNCALVALESSNWKSIIQSIILKNRFHLTGRGLVTSQIRLLGGR